MTKAFEIIAEAPQLSDAQKNGAIMVLSKAAGANGMIGGQVIDIESEDMMISESLLRKLQSLKTGALVRAAISLGVIASNGSESEAHKLDEYAQCVGLMFQITDDILDVTSTTEKLGKTVGSDAANHKTTYVTLLGMEYSYKTVQELLQQSLQILRDINADTEFLSGLVEQMATRTK